MCPGNLRASGHHTPKYENVFVFDNDYPALLPDTPQVDYKQGELIVARGEPGICRVMCFSPRHDLTIARMEKHENSNWWWMPGLRSIRSSVPIL